MNRSPTRRQLERIGVTAIFVCAVIVGTWNTATQRDFGIATRAEPLACASSP